MLITKNQFYEVIKYAEDIGINPKLFDFEYILEEPSRNIFGIKKKQKLKHPYSIIRLKKTTYYFKVKLIKHRKHIEYTKDKFQEEYWFTNKIRETTEYIRNYDYYDTSIEVTALPSVNEQKENYRILGYEKKFSWKELINSYKDWVNVLHEEIEAIKAISKINSLPIFFTSQKYNTEFDFHTEEEKIIIKDKIKQLGDSISSEMEIDKEDLALIINKLDELSNKVDNLNKFDFKTAFFGILVNISSSILYDNSGEFWNIVKRVFDATLLGIKGKFLL